VTAGPSAHRAGHPHPYAVAVGDALDLSQLRELQDLLGADVPEIVATLVRELGAAIERIDAAVAAGDLEAAGLAAHSARNSALMIDARPVLDALGEMELCARRVDAAGVRRSQSSLQLHWPALRASLELAAAAER
jgi:Hpt domain